MNKENMCKNINCLYTTGWNKQPPYSPIEPGPNLHGFILIFLYQNVHSATPHRLRDAKGRYYYHHILHFRAIGGPNRKRGAR